MVIPCPDASQGVSTCGTRSSMPSTTDRCSSDWLVMPPLLLTRRELCTYVVSCNRKAVKGAESYSTQLIRLNDALHVERLTIERDNAGITNEISDYLVRTVQVGKVVSPQVRTRRSPTTITEKYVHFVVRKPFSYITKTEIDATTNPRIYNLFANDVTKLGFMIVRLIFQKWSRSNRNPVKHAVSCLIHQGLAASYVIHAVEAIVILTPDGKTTGQKSANAVGEIFKLTSVSFVVVSPVAEKSTGNEVVEQIGAELRDSQSPWKQGTWLNFFKDYNQLLNYGKAKNSLAKELGFIDEIAAEHPEWDKKTVKIEAGNKAQDLINRYFERIPGASEFINGTYRKIADTKYVETYLGRRRWLPDIMDWQDQQHHRWEAIKEGRDLCWCAECKLSRDGDRQGPNTIIQGTAADICMCAMIRIENDQRLKELEYEMLLQIHDEIVGECPEENAEEAAKIVQYHMEHPWITLRVPLKAAPGIGNTWVEAKS